MRRALVVEDDPDIVELLTHYLAGEGFHVEALADGRAALAQVQRSEPDLLILDLQLPGMDGLEVCRELRTRPRTRHLPVIMLTARGDETDRVVGLELGADDYVVKPFSPKELMARVRAVLRRSGRGEPPVATLHFGDTQIDRERHTVQVRGQSVHLTAKEFALLLTLIDAHGRVLSRRQLLESIWGYSFAEGTRTVDVHVRRLREKLPTLADAIVTVTGVGYRWAAEAET